MTPGSLGTYVINLDSSTARLASAAAELAAAGLDFTRIAAVDGRGKAGADFPEYDRAATLGFVGREMTGGEIGCYLSHIRALRAFLASDAAFGLVLEDDFKLTPLSLPALGLLCADRVPGGFDLCNLGWPALIAKRRLPGLALDGAALFRCYYPPMRTHALFWTRSGAEAFFAARERPRGPLDDVIRDWGVGTGRLLAFRPSVITISGAESDIDGASSGKREPPAKVNPQGHRRYQRHTFRNKVRAYLALARARLTG